MRALVSGEVGFGGGAFPIPGVVSGGASYFVADETFVVSDVFCPLDWCEVYLVDVHCHGVSSTFL